MANTSNRRSLTSSILFILILVCTMSLATFAQTGAKSAESKNFFNQQYLLGDWGGARTKLAEQYGVSFDVFLMSDMMGAVSGGEHQGFGVWNRIRPTMDIDMNKLAHVKGMSLHITSTWNNGTDVAKAPYLGAIGNATGDDTGKHQLRLDSFWVKQNLLHDKVSLYAGQISGFDFFGFQPQDFSHFAMLGPFYAPFALYNNYSSWDPVTTPAAMMQITPNKHFYYRTMVQSITECRDPNGAACGFYNLLNNDTGTSMEVKDGVLWNNEVAFLYGQSGKIASAKSYPGEIHFGVGYTGASQKIFPVQNPAIRQSDGQTNFYWNVKQAVWRPTAGSNRGIDLGGTFVYGSPDKGVLPFNEQLVVTAIFNGIVPKRPKDSFNFALEYTPIRPWIQNVTGQTSEKAYEFNYAAQVTPYWQVMPLVQVYQDLGALSANGNGVVMGVRTVVHF